jgi:hypothetical protein
MDAERLQAAMQNIAARKHSGARSESLRHLLIDPQTAEETVERLFSYVEPDRNGLGVMHAMYSYLNAEGKAAFEKLMQNDGGLAGPYSRAHAANS